MLLQLMSTLHSVQKPFRALESLIPQVLIVIKVIMVVIVFHNSKKHDFACDIVNTDVFIINLSVIISCILFSLAMVARLGARAAGLTGTKMQ